MDTKPYLTFSLHQTLYGIDALLVQEIVYLPELTPIVEAPPDIVGIVNLRGKVLPVMDLNLRFAQPQQDYRLSDSIIVLKWQDLFIGIIVSQVHEVKLIDPAVIETRLSYRAQQSTQTRFIQGLARLETEMLALLNPEALLSHERLNGIETAASVHLDGAPANELPPVTRREFCPQATPEERATFRERAENLRQLTDNQEFTGLLPLAVLGLNGEYFGVDLQHIREFTELRKVTPIPCCPAHIIGNMNLRGEIVTLIDIRQALHMPLSTDLSAAKATIVQINDLVAGLTVDEVFDVTYVRSTEIQPVPTAVNATGDEYLRGTVPYGDKMLGILELPRLLSSAEIEVNQDV